MQGIDSDSLCSWTCTITLFVVQYRPSRLVGWRNRFLGSLNVYKFGLMSWISIASFSVVLATISSLIPRCLGSWKTLIVQCTCILLLHVRHGVKKYGISQVTGKSDGQWYSYPLVTFRDWIILNLLNLFLKYIFLL